MKKRPTIGLALGSGGPRGIAHIGVIKILEQAGVPIDYIAGSSIGAMIGGLYALNKDIKAVERLALSVSWKKAISLIVPSVKQGLTRGEKWEKFLRDQLGFVAIDHLQIPLQIVTTDLVSGRMVCLNRGDLVKAIRASISIPLVFQPVTNHDQVFVDGGLSMPVPVSVVKEMGADIVIAVNVEGDLFDYHHQKKFNWATTAQASLNLLRYHLARQEADTADIAITIHSRKGKLIEEMVWDAQELISTGEHYAKTAVPKILDYLK